MSMWHAKIAGLSEHSLHNRSTLVRWSLVCLVWCSLQGTTAAYADDRALIQTGSATGSLAIVGEVLDYTGRGLELRLRPSGVTRRYNVSEVLDVSTTTLEPHQRGRAHLQAGQWTEAISALEEALDDEERTWVRREILSLQVQAALHLNDRLRAMDRFLAIVESDADTIYYSHIPLEWSTGPVSSREVPPLQVIERARQWLPRASGAAQLMAASVLLQVPADAEEARRTLRVLSRDGNVLVQRLAQMQTWRERIAVGNITDEELLRWENSLDSTPSAVRAGGCYLTGTACRQRGEWDRAAGWLLFVPHAYPHDPRLVTAARLSAADCLDQLGKTAEANQLRTEANQPAP